MKPAQKHRCAYDSKDVQRPEPHYLETGIYGAYETAWLTAGKVNGNFVPLFEDTQLTEQSDTLSLERRMVVGGRAFSVCSVFPKDAAATPTDKLLSLIDREQKKG
ncbi:MAG: hypothetical protein VB078_11850 [Clostridiaceae bacterium]|nr:hypothetical protein [Clostridiaceae bacterium]